MKTSQLIIYKEYYAKQYNVPVDNIDVEFMILKRRLFESSAFPQKRVQKIVPASGNVTRKRVRTSIEKFVDNAFDERAEISNTFVFDRQRIAIVRPLTVGLRYKLKF